jgi:hypothetical protein
MLVMTQATASAAAAHDASSRAHMGVVSAIVLFTPAIWLVAFWSLVLRARIHLGEWPHGSRGFLDGVWQGASLDPSHFNLHAAAVWLLLPFAGMMIALGTILLVGSIGFRALRPSRFAALVFAVGSGLAIATVMLDLGGYWWWFLD